MATSRRSATNENISTFGAGGFGRDYTDVNTWAAATEIDLVSAAQSEVLELYDDAASFNQKIVVEAATTNASYFRIVRPAGVKGEASWQGHDGTPNNGVFFSISGVGGDAWRIDESFSSFQDLLIKAVLNDVNPRSVYDVRGADVEIVGCIAFDSSNIGTSTLIAGFEQSEDNFCINCLALNCELDGFQIDGATDAYAYNCTAVNNGSDGFFNKGNGTCKNCLADGNSPDFSGSPAGNNNASGDGTATGTGSRINQTFTFVATGSDNYHLASGDAGAKDFGADLSADGVFAFDDDIDWETRTGSWDIGFDEFLAAIAFPVLSDRDVHSNIFGNRIVR